MVVPGENPASSAAANTNGLKAEPGWRFASVARLIRALGEVAAADHGAHVAGGRLDGHQRRLQRVACSLPLVQLGQALGHGLLPRIAAPRNRAWCKRAGRRSARFSTPNFSNRNSWTRLAKYGAMRHADRVDFARAVIAAPASRPPAWRWRCRRSPRRAGRSAASRAAPSRGDRGRWPASCGCRSPTGG